MYSSFFKIKYVFLVFYFTFSIWPQSTKIKSWFWKVVTINVYTKIINKVIIILTWPRLRALPPSHHLRAVFDASSSPHTPLKNIFEGYTKIYFAKNQLSLSLISLSLLITNHLNLFLQVRVQSSSQCYH